MPITNVPNYSGDPAKCTLCKEGIFPHTHEPDAEWADTAPKVNKPVKRTKRATTTDPSIPKRRGRPMSPENALLLKVCDCKIRAL